MSGAYTPSAVYKQGCGLIGPDLAREVIRQLEPAFQKISQLDLEIATNKRLLKAQKKHRKVEKSRRVSVQKAKGYRRDPGDLGWANGHRRDPQPVYSPWPTWHQPGGRHPKKGAGS